MTDMQVLPRSSSGGFMYCPACTGEPVTIWVPAGGVRLCGDCLAAAETTFVSNSPTGDEHGEQR